MKARVVSQTLSRKFSLLTGKACTLPIIYIFMIVWQVYGTDRLRELVA